MTNADLEKMADLPPHQVAVVLVDFQNDFCHPDACHARPPSNTANAATALWANDFARRAAYLGAHVIYSRQVLDLARLTPLQRRWESSETGLCVEGSWGAKLFVNPIPGSSIVRKDRFDLWQSREFVDLLESRDVTALIIGGVELRCCVLFAVLGADERGYRCVVPHDLVSGQDTDAALAPIRQYLTVVYEAPPTAQSILDSWAARQG